MPTPKNIARIALSFTTLLLLSGFLMFWLPDCGTVSFAQQQSVSEFEKDTALLQQYYTQAFDSYGKGNRTQTILLMRKACEIVLKYPDTLNDGVIFSYVFLAEQTINQDSIHHYLTIAKKAIQKSDSIKKEVDPEWRLRHIYGWGRYYYISGDFDKALSYYKEYIHQAKKSSGALSKDHLYLALSYAGYINFAKGNYARAKSYIEESKAYLTDSSKFSEGHHYALIGQTLFQMRDSQAFSYYLRARDIFKSVGGADPRSFQFLPRINTVIAAWYIDRQRLDSAAIYLKEAYINHRYDAAFLPDWHWQQARLLIEQKNHPEARRQIESGLEASNAMYNGGKHYKKGILYALMSTSFLKTNEYDTALQYVQKAFAEYSTNFNNLDLNATPALNTCFARKELLQAFQLKSRILSALYEERRQVDLLKRALQTYDSAFALIQLLRQDYRDDAAKDFLADQTFDVVEEAFSAALELHEQNPEAGYFDKAFSFAEKSKSLSLLEALHHADAVQFARIPPDLVDREKTLRRQIGYYEAKLIQGQDSTLAEQYKKSLWESRKSHEQLILTLEKDYKDYYELKYGAPEMNIPEISDKLAALDAAMVSFVWGKTNLYAIYLSGSHRLIHATPIDDTLKKQLIDFNNTVSNELAFNSASSLSAFQQLGIALKSRLLGAFPLETSRLIFSPDGLLHGLPFAALSHSGNNENSEFLLRKFAVSYAYSASVWVKNMEKEVIPSDHYLAMAPVNYKDEKLPDLSSGITFLSAFQKIWGRRGLVYEKEAANKKQFIDAANSQASYNNVVLYTHATANGNPCIYFYDDPLPLNELYGETIRANMVNLIGCETGKGKYHRGEGVMSLARGFSYAGTPSLTTTLWSVSEGATMEIATAFHKHLESGLHKDIALQRAQADFMDHNSINEATPYFWAGLVVIGNIEPVYQKQAASGWWLLLLLPALGGVIWLRRQTMEKKS